MSRPHQSDPPFFQVLCDALALASSLQLINKRGERVGFVPNREQQRIVSVMLRQARAGLPVRVIILKARQVGASTLVELLFYALVRLIGGARAFVTAHDDDSSQVLYAKIQFAHDGLQADRPTPTRYCTRKEITFTAPHNGHLKVQTAGNLTLGRSDTFQFLHESEIAHWREQGATLSSVQQCVTHQPGTIIVKESTANGVGDAFEREWAAATARLRANPEDLDGYVPIFVSWLSEPDYAMDVGADYPWGELSPEEVALQRLGASGRQLRWRRWKIANDFNGEAELFKQEYPSHPAEAFRTSGRPAIPERIKAGHRRTVRPGRRCRLEYADEDSNVVRAVFREDYAGNYWQVWAEPDPACDYTVGGDVAEGEVSDLKNPASAPDESALVVLNRATPAMVAVWHGQIEPDILGAEMVKAGYWYQRAWLSPEVNACGRATLLAIKRARYPRLYVRLAPSDSTEDHTAQNVYGWRTTGQNREEMIDAWNAACRPDEAGSFAASMKVYSQDLLEEEETFIYTKTGRREHRAGQHDDILFAAMIALQLHLRCPRTRPGPAVRRRVRDAYDISALAYGGVVDPLAERFAQEAAAMLAKQRMKA